VTFRTAIFIDLDETLIEGPFDHVVWPAVLQELSAKTGFPIEPLMNEIVAENRERQNNDSVSAVAAMDWDDIVQAVASRHGVTLETSLVALVESHAAETKVLDEGASILRELAATERALVVATKGLAKYQRPLLDAAGLTPLFQDILTPDRCNALKKDSGFFADWPERVKRCIMVGDRYDDDVLYPSARGFKTVWKQIALPEALAAENPFARARLYPYADWQTARPDAIIVSLGELPEVIYQLEAVL
jgi:putative hydrolase of the HAD superfamily